MHVESTQQRVKYVAPRHEYVEQSGGVAPLILNLDARWRRILSFTPRPLYRPGIPLSCSHWIETDGAPDPVCKC